MSIAGIPAPYVISFLHKKGKDYFNNKSNAFELRVKGINKPFFVHLEYLTFQSKFFRESFVTVKEGDLVLITVPSPETFEPILEYLYFGNGDKWYDTITSDNYNDVWENVEYLGLDEKAKTVCLVYYQAHIEQKLFVK